MMRFTWNIIGVIMFLATTLRAETQNNILILHSYHQGLMWTDQISKGISDVFQDYPEYELEYYYLNARRTFDQKYLKKQEDIITHDILSYDYEAIIVSDNAAFDFVKNLPDSVLGDVPLICCGVNGLGIEPFSENCHIIHEDIDFQGAFLMIADLMPALDTLVIISDHSKVGRLTRMELEEELKLFDCPFDLVYYDDYTLNELKSSVAHLTGNKAIYLLVFNQDNEGTYISYNYGLRTITELANVPIFGAWHFYMNKGVVGGKLSEGHTQGRLAAMACLKLLKYGVLLDSDLVVRSKYMVDYHQMKKFGFKFKALPPSTVVCNRPDRKPFVRLFYAVTILLLVVLILHRRNERYLKRVVLERTLELQQALSHKDQFFSLLAHDLRSPVGNIAQSLRLLERKGDALPAQRRAQMMRELTKTSSRVFHLLEDLLVWGRFQFSSRYEAQMSTFELKAVVDDVCEVYYLEKNKSLFQNEVSTSLKLYNDVFVLKFVLRNLISNAIKYSPDDAKIIIGAKHSEDSVCFWVKDEGQGMSPNVIRSILDKVPIQTPGVKGQKSFGLGLRSVQAYLQQINGEMRIESTEGLGSCFYINLKK